MSFSILKQIGDAQKKKAVVDVRSGDTVKVTQKIKEGIINQKDPDKNFGGYKLGLLFTNLLFKTTIFQIFGTRQEKNT